MNLYEGRCYLIFINIDLNWKYFNKRRVIFGWNTKFLESKYSLILCSCRQIWPKLSSELNQIPLWRNELLLLLLLWSLLSLLEYHKSPNLILHWILLWVMYPSCFQLLFILSISAFNCRHSVCFDLPLFLLPSEF